MAATQSEPRTRVHRRWFLRRGAAAAAGAAAATVAASTPAAAAPSNMQLSGANAGDGNPTTVTNSNFQVTATGGIAAVKGIASNAGGSSGVRGEATSGSAVGVSALNSSGLAITGATSAGDSVAVEATNLGNGPQLRLVSNAFVIPPATGDFLVGQLAMSGASLWLCYQSGTGPASKWVRLSAAFVPVDPPVRVFDSRPGTDNSGGSTQGPLTFSAAPPSAAFREVNCSQNATGGAVVVPTGATTLLLNLAVVALSGVGALNVYKHGVTQPNTANINWSAGGQVLSNAVTAACDANRHVDVAIVASTGASAHFIIDVVGYYL